MADSGAICAHDGAARLVRLHRRHMRRVKGELQRDPAAVQRACLGRRRGSARGIHREKALRGRRGHDSRHLRLRQAELPGDGRPARRRRAEHLRQQQREQGHHRPFLSVEEKAEFRHALGQRRRRHEIAAAREQKSPDEFGILAQPPRALPLRLENIEGGDRIGQPAAHEADQALGRLVDPHPAVRRARPCAQKSAEPQQRQHGLERARADLAAMRAQRVQPAVGRAAIHIERIAAGIEKKQIADHAPGRIPRQQLVEKFLSLAEFGQPFAVTQQRLCKCRRCGKARRKGRNGILLLLLLVGHVLVPKPGAHQYRTARPQPVRVPDQVRFGPAPRRLLPTPIVPYGAGRRCVAATFHENFRSIGAAKPPSFA